VKQSSDTDSLFQLPPAEFTAARNALAGKLKKAGRDDEAARVKALIKPSLPAWAVNQLYWQQRKAFDRLIEAGDAFRKAQGAQLGGRKADLRGPLEARREALSDLTRLAAEVMRKAGHNPTPDIVRRITTTLEALATYGSHEGAPPAGRLTDDIDPPGFEALAALVPQVGRAKRDGSEPTRIIPFQQKAREPRGGKKKLAPAEAARQREEERKAKIAAATAALAEADRALRDAKKEAEAAETELKRAAARAKEAEREKAEIEKRYEKLSAAAESARQEARRVASTAEDAAQAVEDAERAVEKAKSELAAARDES
jgi:DNA repair exonuclease SbcCD ATPase subunit